MGDHQPEPGGGPDTRLTRTVLGVEFITDSVFVLRMERDGLFFTPGQHILVGKGNDLREYSIYSGTIDPFLEILVKRIDTGAVSPLLASLRPGDELDTEGPFGNFILPGGKSGGGKYLFVATGTGIAPYRCFVRSYGRLDYRLLHGVRYARECYGREEFDSGRFVACLTREPGSDFHGRVTDFLRTEGGDPEAECYLCGNSSMIFDAFGILTRCGVPRERIHAEIYF